MVYESTHQALRESLISDEEVVEDSEGPYNVVDGLFAIAHAIRYLADRLGTGDAFTRMGGMEVIATKIDEGLGQVAGAIHRIGED